MANEERRRVAGQAVLQKLGVAADEEHVYRVLLRNPGASLAELRGHTALGHRRLRSALTGLERKAMVARRGGIPVRYRPAPPDIVVEALISAREEELNRARLDAHQLTSLLHTPPEQVRAGDLVEILATAEAVGERLLQLQLVARERIEVLVRPPFAGRRPDGEEAAQRSLLQRGVTTLAVYDEQALTVPGALEHIGRMTALGERARVVSRLPLKLAIFDRRTALVPLAQPHPDRPDPDRDRDRDRTVDAGLVVRDSALLDALVALFDTYWRRGTDIRLTPPPAPRRAPGADPDAVLTLLVSGAKDESIARQLGVSAHTVRRRIAGLLDRLGVTTRFQAGFALGRSGWPDTSGPDDGRSDTTGPDTTGPDDGWPDATGVDRG